MNKAKAWLAGFVRRWHTHPILSVTVDPIDGHSARVAILILQLRPDASAALLRAALLHDLGEFAVGDMAAPVKMRHPELYAAAEALEREAIEDLGFRIPDLDPAEAALLKLCDGIDAYLWALHHRPGMVCTHPGWIAHFDRLAGRAEDLGLRAEFEALVEGVRAGVF